MSRIPVLYLALLAGCGRDGAEISAVRGDISSTVTLRLGETGPVRGTPLLLTFRRVSEDSRCPVDSASEPLELHLHREPREVSRQGYTLTLVGLQPALRTDQPLPRARYRATPSVVAH